MIIAELLALLGLQEPLTGIGPFAAAEHRDLVALLVQVTVLLFVARTLGEVSKRIGQPQVIGELLAGIVLGPSLLSGMFPGLGQWIVPQTDVQGFLLELVAMVGAMFLLLITGLETDIQLIKRKARTALSVSWGGIAVTFTSGLFLGLHLPEFLMATEDRLVFALFVAVAMAISAIPVIAKVLIDLGLTRRDVGQTIIAAGMSDDTTGWILLSIILGVAAGGALTARAVLAAVGSVLAFLVLAFTLGRWLIRRMLNYIQDRATSEDRLVTLVVVAAFGFGAITEALHLEAMLGAFVAGIIFGQLPRLPEEVHHKLESIALGIFAPIFFAVAGLKVNAWALFTPTLATLALVVIAVAIAGKYVGTYLGGRLIGGADHWTALSFGSGLNARGAMEIIIATIGLRVGILSQEMFSIIVVMAMATSIMAPFALRASLRRVTPEEQELLRLRREELAAGSVVAGIHRVLLPVRRRDVRGEHPIHSLEARVLERMSRTSVLSITLFNVTDPEGRPQAEQYLQEVAQQFHVDEVLTRVVEGDDPALKVLEEAQKNYDLIIMGASEESPDRETLFTRPVDHTVRMAPCATVVVHARELSPDGDLRRILVPTNGSQAAKNAAELAFKIAGADADHVKALNVVIREERSRIHDASGTYFEHQVAIGHQIVDELRDLGEALGVPTETDVREGPDPESVILEVARRGGYELIVLGTNVRPASERLFIGPRVERILRRAPCPVLIINTPEGPPLRRFTT